MTDRAFEPANPDPFTQAAAGKTEAAELPYSEDMFPEKPNAAKPAQPNEVPYSEYVFPDKPPASTKPIVGPFYDWAFGDTDHSSLARIAKAFWRGEGEAVGPEGANLRLSEASEKYLKEKGVFNDYAAGQFNVLKGLNETLIRGATIGINTALYGIPALFAGGQAAVAETGEQAEKTAVGKAIGAKSLAGEIAAVPEAFPTFQFGTQGLKFRPRAIEIPAPLAAAHDLGVIGGDEATWKGTAPVEVDEKGLPVPPPAVTAEAAPRETSAGATQDVHAVARQIAPGAFQEYDALTKRRDLFRKWIDEMEDGGRPADDLKRVAGGLKEAEARIKELQPAVDEAYDKAREGLPADFAKPPVEPAAEVQAPQPAAPPASEVIPEATKPKAVEPIEQQKSYIASDFERQTIEAGKPAEMPEPQWREHAKAMGHLVADHYEAMAAWFDGKLGNARDFYEREGAEVIGHGQQSSMGRQARAAPKVDETKLSLLEFAAEKGLRSTADLRYTLGDNPKARGKKIFRPDGMTEDQFREAASEAGYLVNNAERTGEQASLKELHEALRDESKGRKRYRLGHEPEAEAREGPEHEEFHEGLEPHEMEELSHDDLAHLSEEDREALAFLQVARGSLLPRPDQGLPPLLRIGRAANASTLPHELLGHAFLEELAKYAEHPEAPPQLRADWEATKEHLEIASRNDLNTGQPGEQGRKARTAHERFATTLEQYMAEGVAPSHELANVFSRFRTWFLQIYGDLQKSLQTLIDSTPNGEEVIRPLTEKMRGVYDRLLAVDPKRVRIEPEREMPKDFADEHEAHAERTPPEYKDMIGDRIDSERDFLAAHGLLEEDDARLENTGRQVGGQPPGSEKPPGHADETGPSPGEAGTAAEPGTERAGVGETEARGAGTSTEPGAAAGAEGGGAAEGQPQPGGPIARIEVPPGPGMTFPKGESPRVDKIGNFRIDGINLPEDIDLALREAAERRSGFAAERRITNGPITDGQAMQLALASGQDTAWLDRKAIGDAYSKEEIFLLEHLFSTAATAVKETASAAKSGDQAAVLAHAESMARLEMLQAKLAGATSEAGRSLAAIRAVVKKTFATTAELSDFLKKETGRTLFQLQEVARYGEKLSTPAQVARLVNDTKNGKIKQAVIFYYVNALISGPITHTRYAAGNVLTALWAPLVKTPFAATVGTTREMLGFENENRVHLGEAGAELYGLLKGSREGWRAAREGWETGNTPALPGEGAPELFGAQPMIPPIPGKIGYALGLPGKAVGAIHGFSSALRYEQEIHKLAYRAAMVEKLEGHTFTNRVAELTDRPTPEMMEAASKTARKDLYMAPTDYDSLAGKLTRAANHNVFTKIIVPFMKIGTQITHNALIEQSPLGLFNKQVRDNLSGRNGGAALDMQAGSIIGGTALMGAMAMMASEGLATGDGPSDPGKRAVWLLNHHPNSLQIGGVTVPYQGLGSLGMLMRLAANAYETHQGWGDDEGHSIALDYLHGFEKAVLDENFMRGIKDLVDAVYHYEEYGDRYIATMMTNWIPFSVGLGQVSRKVDPYQRETRGNSLTDMIFNEAQAKVPWLSQGLYPRRDMFGEPIPSSGPVQNYANDPTVKMMGELHMKVGRLEHKIRGVPLTDKQFDDFSRIAGRTAKMLLDSAVRTPGFDRLLPNARMELMHKAINRGREEAAKAVMMQSYNGDNDIVRKATDAKAIKKGVKEATH